MPEDAPPADAGPNGSDRPTDFVQSVGRALRVLELAAAEPGLPVKAIARRCQINLSTTYHLVRTLAYEGYLVRLPGGTYVVGDEVGRRFYDMLGTLGEPPAARTVLRHLSERTGLSAYLGRLDGERVVVVDYVEGDGSPYLEELERGLSISAHATALGKALLLAMPQPQRRSYLRTTGLRPFTSRTSRDPAQLEAELAQLSEDSVIVEHGEFRDSVSCAARLLPRPTRDEAAWAIVVSARGDDIPRPVRHELDLAASDLGGNLG